MNDIDDPPIPDDLRQLLRSAAAELDVTPAPIRSVERRARQRRGRRHTGLAAAAAIVLVALALRGATTAGDRTERLVTATDPQPAGPVGSAPQPLLLPNPKAPERLDEVTPAGVTTWWATSTNFQPVQGVLLVDGRRFGRSVNAPDDHLVVKGAPERAVLDQIGTDGRAIGSRPLGRDLPKGSSASFAIAGATGTELILTRSQTTPAVVTQADRDAKRERFNEHTTITAYDVDSHAERTIREIDGSGTAAAAADRLVLAPSTSCELEVQDLSGGAPRTVDGGCPRGLNGLDGLAAKLAVSPNGRYVAAIWIMIRPDGATKYGLTVLDLHTGKVAARTDVSALWPVHAMAWTANQTLTLAVDADRPTLGSVSGPIDLVVVPYDLGG